VCALKAAGFKAVQVVDTRKDLNAYSQAEGQGCCTPAMDTAPRAESACCTPAPAGSDSCCTPKVVSMPALASDCCTPAPNGSSDCCAPNIAQDEATVHSGLAELLRKYDVNEFAASVQVYAIKPTK
jgi:arsenite methyltransferase